MSPKVLRESEAEQYENVHDWLKQELSLPEWYGRNLDALWDCITGHLARPLEIRWVADSAHEDRYAAIVELLQEAADEYDDISFEQVSEQQED